MGIVTVSLPSDGTAADVSDYNTPITTIVTAVNGNLDSSNLASNAVSTAKIAAGAVTNAKLSTTAGELGGAWQSYVPTWTSLTVGNGTVVAKYQQVGKTVHFSIQITFGSTTSAGSATVRASLPVTSVSYFNFAHILGFAGCYDLSATAAFPAVTSWYNTTTIEINPMNAAGTYAQHGAVTTTTPFTWATGDVLVARGTYEAA